MRKISVFAVISLLPFLVSCAAYYPVYLLWDAASIALMLKTGKPKFKPGEKPEQVLLIPKTSLPP